MKLESHSEIKKENENTYILTEDVTFISKKVSKEFNGVLDGNGHTIEIDLFRGKLFEKLNGTLKNLKFKSSGRSIVKENHGVIKNCTNNNVKYTIGDSAFGGLCKENHGVIKNCTVKGKIKADCAGFITGKNHGLIEGCETDGYIFGQSVSGGICGRQIDGTITNCSSSATVESLSTAGGICGIQERIDKSTVFKSCSFDGEIDKVRSHSGVILGDGVDVTYKNCSSKNAYIKGSSSSLFEVDVIDCDFTIEFYNTGQTKDIFDNKIQIKNSHLTLSLLNISSLQLFSTASSTPVQFIETELYIEAVTTTKTEVNVCKSLNIEMEAIPSEELTINTSNKQIINKNVQNVSTEEELFNCNKYDTIQLQDDITITKNKTIFSVLLSEIAGNGHTIRNLQKPLCFEVSKHAAISDLTITNSFIRNDTMQEGTGTLTRIHKGEITNITVKDSTAFSEKENVGGIVGMCSSNNAKITNSSVVNLNIKGTNQCGAIAGTISEYSDLTVKDCTVNGHVDVGGVYGHGTESNNTSNQKTVVNNSTITGVTNVGGCFGKEFHTETKKHTVKNSEITGQQRVGGLAGNTKVNITNSTVENATITGESVVGGFIGKTKNKHATIQIQNCKVDVEITGNEVSGFIGYSENIDIRNCISLGSIKGTNIAGFILKCQNSSIETSYCQNKLTGIKNSSLFAISVKNSKINAFTLSESTINNSNSVIHELEKSETNLCWSTLLNPELSGKTSIGTPVDSKDIDEFKTLSLSIAK